jgi:hypothetical protein
MGAFKAKRCGSTPSPAPAILHPKGGSSVGVDPIGLFAASYGCRQNVHEFVLSLEGQKLWNFKVERPRTGQIRAQTQPIRKELMLRSLRLTARSEVILPGPLFVYHPEWTSLLFKVISFIIRVMCLDSHEEQVPLGKF